MTTRRKRKKVRKRRKRRERRRRKRKRRKKKIKQHPRERALEVSLEESSIVYFYLLLSFEM